MYRWWTESRLWLMSCTEERGRGRAQARSSAEAQSASLAARRSSLRVKHPQSPSCRRPSDRHPGTYHARAHRPPALATVVSTNEMEMVKIYRLIYVCMHSMNKHSTLLDHHCSPWKLGYQQKQALCANLTMALFHFHQLGGVEGLSEWFSDLWGKLR